MSDQNPVLLVLGTRADSHIQRVVRELERRAATQIFVLDYLDDTRFSLEENSAGQTVFRINGITLPALYLVWDRTKLLPGTELYLPGDERFSGYAAQEWRAFYKLLCGLNRGRVVNSLESRSCMIKPYQQAVAASVGFRVPPTLVSNDRNSVQAFQRQNDDQLIMKSVSAGKVGTTGDGGENIPFVVMTMRVSPEDLEAATPEEIAYCPHVFQREVQKTHELRVVVVDDQMLAFRIDSQKHPLSSLDWRKGIDVAGFTATSLDDDTLTRIQAFMSQMGLFTGSLDLIVDPEEQVWFLECNQDGAWGWLDDIAEGAITRAFADGFTRRLSALTVSPP